MKLPSIFKRAPRVRTDLRPYEVQDRSGNVKVDPTLLRRYQQQIAMVEECIARHSPYRGEGY